MDQEHSFRKISDEEIGQMLEPLNAITIEYQQISEEDLKSVLEQHSIWLRTKGESGERANLRLVDLSVFGLENEILRGAILDDAYFDFANMERVNLDFASMKRCKMRRTNLRRSFFECTGLKNADLEGADLRGADFWHTNLDKANLKKTDMRKARLRQVHLRNAKLTAANLKDAKLIDVDLSNAHLEKVIFTKAELINVNLQDAKMQYVNLQNTILWQTDMRRCDLYRGKLQGSDLAGANLREIRANLAEFRGELDNNREYSESSDAADRSDKDYVDNPPHFNKEEHLSGDKGGILLDAHNLHARQLAGASLANACLPDFVWQGFNDGLANVAEATKKVDKLFVGLLAGCAYFALVLALLKPGALVKLPIINTLIPQKIFFWTAPVGVLLVYLYFQLNLQRLWERLAELPAIFEDGTPLDKKASPWLPVGYVRAHFSLLRKDDRPPLSKVQTLAVQLLIWWTAPAVLTALWLRYLQDSPAYFVCVVQIAVTMTIVGVNCVLLQLARRTLRLEKPPWVEQEVRQIDEDQIANAKFYKKLGLYCVQHWVPIVLMAAVGVAMSWYSWHVISNAPLC